MTGTFTEALAEFASQTASPTALAKSVVRLSALDWLACGIAGASEPVSGILHSMAVEESGAQQAFMFGGGAAPARMVALVNGTTSPALAFDATHAAHNAHHWVDVFSAQLSVVPQLGRTLSHVM